MVCRAAFLVLSLLFRMRAASQPDKSSHDVAPINAARIRLCFSQDNRLGHVEIDREAIETLARWYAREAGVRNLSKLVDKVLYQTRAAIVSLLLFVMTIVVVAIVVCFTALA